MLQITDTDKAVTLLEERPELEIYYQVSALLTEQPQVMHPVLEALQTLQVLLLMV